MLSKGHPFDTQTELLTLTNVRFVKPRNLSQLQGALNCTPIPGKNQLVFHNLLLVQRCLGLLGSNLRNSIS